jgi:hypothetical protein
LRSGFTSLLLNLGISQYFKIKGILFAPSFLLSCFSTFYPKIILGKISKDINLDPAPLWINQYDVGSKTPIVLYKPLN